MQGRTTTWRFKLTNILVSGDIWGYLGWDDNEENRQAAFEYKVCISEYMQKDHRRNEFPEVKIDDWLVVTGEFIGVSPDGDVMLKPLRVVNEGYK